MKSDIVGNGYKVCETYNQDQNRFMCQSPMQRNKLYKHITNR